MIENFSDENIAWTVTDFVAVFNQTIDFAYPEINIIGELSNFRLSKNKWVYFDLKDDHSSLKFFGSVYSLPGPLEEGMKVLVKGNPRLHNIYGFSINFKSIKPVGEGSIKKAQDLLFAKLSKEGLFEDSRKRNIPFPPNKIGLITSTESAAYHDFNKVLNNRWQGIEIFLRNVQVQGEPAVDQIVNALNEINLLSDLEVIVITRGGGSADDLAVFSNEKVVRSIASSRIPTLVAVGHEVDISLAEMAADKRASTPSNAAELLVPETHAEISRLKNNLEYINNVIFNLIQNLKNENNEINLNLNQQLDNELNKMREHSKSSNLIIEALNPEKILSKGFVIVRDINEKIIKHSNKLKDNDTVTIQFQDGRVKSLIQKA